MSVVEPAPEIATADQDELRRSRRRKLDAIARYVLPVAVMVLAIWLWGRIVVWNEIPHYILPGPDRVWGSLTGDWDILFTAALLTAKITLMALVLAVIGGAGLAILFNQSKMLEIYMLPLS